ncbi:unnamed protein product [Closterium sp. NIES-65]|nr:unnamed protein product [Closterium sp. NIES-65]
MLNLRRLSNVHSLSLPPCSTNPVATNQVNRMLASLERNADVASLTQQQTTCSCYRIRNDYCCFQYMCKCSPVCWNGYELISLAQVRSAPATEHAPHHLSSAQRGPRAPISPSLSPVPPAPPASPCSPLLLHELISHGQPESQVRASNGARTSPSRPATRAHPCGLRAAAGLISLGQPKCAPATEHAPPLPGQPPTLTPVDCAHPQEFNTALYSFFTETSGGSLGVWSAGGGGDGESGGKGWLESRSGVDWRFGQTMLQTFNKTETNIAHYAGGWVGGYDHWWDGGLWRWEGKQGGRRVGGQVGGWVGGYVGGWAGGHHWWSGVGEVAFGFLGWEV